MIIGIDGNEANIKNRVGVNTYAYELIKNIRKLQDKWSSRDTVIIYLKDKPLDDMPEQTAKFKYRVIPGSKLWILTKLTPDLYLNPEKPDIFFSPSHYIPFFATVPKVCSIMDLGYLDNSAHFPKKVFWQLKWWSAISIYVSKAVISISESTAKDIVRHYPATVKKIHITHLAYDKNIFNSSIPLNDVRRVKNKYSIVTDYVLYLGTLKPSKNIEGLLKAYRAVSQRFNRTKLVIAGKKGWMYETIYKTVKDLGLEDKVLFTDFLPEEDKPGLIKGAKVFVLPSYWEGFGLDVLNAMAAGVPVIASDRGSLPEVLGAAGIKIDPENINSIADALIKVLSMGKSEYNRMVKEGLTRAEKFSWERTALKTLEIIENVHIHR